MALIRAIGLVLLLGATLTPTVQADDASFNSYFEGALQVYSKFKEPSKQESEQFYSFIKSKWQKETCVKNCVVDGKSAGLEYAWRNSVELVDRDDRG